MKKKICAVIGLGEFGYHLAVSLSEQKIDVIALDNDEVKINRIKIYVSQAIIGDARNEQVLSSAIPKDVDHVIIALGTIESSIMAALYFKENRTSSLFVKAINDQHFRILKMLGIQNILFPEKDVAERFSKQISHVNLLDYLPISDEYSLIEVPPLSKMGGKTLKELDFRAKFKMSIIAIKRDGKLIFQLDANRIINDDDIFFVVGLNDDVDKYHKLLQQEKKRYTVIR
ncbi:TrkA family potassium uptake protein [bacterium]|nr:TrkA family potassium uptake protein [bacterium]